MNQWINSLLQLFFVGELFLILETTFVHRSCQSPVVAQLNITWLPDFSMLSISKAAAVLKRAEESLDHFSLQEVAVELIQLVHPEVKPIEIAVRRIVWVPSQVTKVLHLHKRAV